MPVPIMFDTTSAVALTTPSCLRREGLLGAVTLIFYRDSAGSPLVPNPAPFAEFHCLTVPRGIMLRSWRAKTTS
jgi:hypothetical protein